VEVTHYETLWDNCELPVSTDSYNVHKNVKLTQEQAAAIEASGEPDSQWIREAVEMRLLHEEALRQQGNT
jgi:hypothetical protein